MRILPLLILNLLPLFQDRTAVQPHGPDFRISCSTCHSSKGWHLDKEIYSFNHNSTLFPLTGEHAEVNCRQCHPTLIFKDAKTQCVDCHKSESLVRFDVPGVNCIDCHRQEYESTTQPDHVQAGFSENCITCHSINAFQWGGAGFNHSFFPLTGGHSQSACDGWVTGTKNLQQVFPWSVSRLPSGL